VLESGSTTASSEQLRNSCNGRKGDVSQGRNEADCEDEFENCDLEVRGGAIDSAKYWEREGQKGRML